MTRVLVVDDDPDVLDTMRDLLEIMLPGVEVEAVMSGPAAVDAFQRRRADAIVTDFRMPAMTGVELAREIHRLLPGVPILLVTAFAEDVLGGDAGHVRQVLRKPFDPVEFVDAVRSTLAAASA